MDRCEDLYLKHFHDDGDNGDDDVKVNKVDMKWIYIYIYIYIYIHTLALPVLLFGSETWTINLLAPEFYI
jgi:hypothetical protein